MSTALTRFGTFIFDCFKRVLRAAKPQPLSPGSPFPAALLAAGLAFLAGMVTAYWSNYATRRDQHIQEAQKCTGLTSSLLTTALLIQEFSIEDIKAIATPPLSPNNQVHKFLLPPLDEIIRSQYGSIDLLDYKTRDLVMRLEQYYRGVRDDIANTSGVYHAGSTFGVYTDSDKTLYAGLLNLLSQEAADTIGALSASHQCKILGETSIFWPSARRAPPR